MNATSALLMTASLLGLGALAAAVSPAGSDASDRQKIVVDPGRGIVHLELRAEKRRYRRLEPIVVEYTLTNVSRKNELIGVHVATPQFKAVELRVRYRGSEAPHTLYYTTFPPVSMGNYRVLHPGSSIRGSLTANTLYDMTADGDYTLEVSIPWSRITRDGASRPGAARSEAIQVSVDGPPEASGN